jgi:hypothetical protein
MHPAEQKLRTAAVAMLAAVNEARAAGFALRWPHQPEGLATISISATEKALTPDGEIALPSGEPVTPAPKKRRSGTAGA